MAVRLEPRRRLTEHERASLAGAAARVLARHPEVLAAYLFGSSARGEPARDVDVGIATDRPLPAPRRQEIERDLQDEWTAPGLALDVRPLTGTSPRLRATVVREGRRLYERDRGARVAFEVQALSQWLDFKPVWLRMRSGMLERLRRG